MTSPEATDKQSESSIGKTSSGAVACLQEYRTAQQRFSAPKSRNRKRSRGSQQQYSTHSGTASPDMLSAADPSACSHIPLFRLPPHSSEETRETKPLSKAINSSDPDNSPDPLSNENDLAEHHGRRTNSHNISMRSRLRNTSPPPFDPVPDMVVVRAACGRQVFENGGKVEEALRLVPGSKNENKLSPTTLAGKHVPQHWLCVDVVTTSSLQQKAPDYPHVVVERPRDSEMESKLFLEFANGESARAFCRQFPEEKIIHAKDG